MKRRHYEPLGSYLARARGPAHALTFAEVEAILGRRLPSTAYTRRDWWTNDPGHSQADYGWLGPGWLVASVDRRRRMVTFRTE
jgi:hypothetical protein